MKMHVKGECIFNTGTHLGVMNLASHQSLHTTVIDQHLLKFKLHTHI